MKINELIELSGVMARGWRSKDAAEIELREHINGSGPKFYGGARRWPALKVIISFKEDEKEETIDEMVADIKSVLLKYGYGEKTTSRQSNRFITEYKI